MTKEAVRDLNSKCNQATKEFDDYNTIVKKITVVVEDHVANLVEVRSGHIKMDGTEIARNFKEMKSQMVENATITIEEA